MFYFRGFIILALIFRPMANDEMDIFTWYEARVIVFLLFLAYAYLIVQAAFLERLSLLH